MNGDRHHLPQDTCAVLNMAITDKQPKLTAHERRMRAQSKNEEEQLRSLWGDLEYLKAQITPREQRLRVLKRKSAIKPARVSECVHISPKA